MGIAEWRDGSGKADFIAVPPRPAGVPGFDLSDFRAAKDRFSLESCILKINAVMGCHFPAHFPPILFMTAIGKSFACASGFAALRSGRPRV